MFLSLRKVIYGSGETVSVLGVTVIGLYFLYFLTDVVGIAPVVASAIFMIGRGWDAILDPLIGIISDRTKSRWGRRRPYFIFSSVPLLLFFSLLWFHIKSDHQLIVVLYYTIFYILFMTTLSLFYVPYLGMISEFSVDYNERTSINNYRIFFQLFFGLIAATIPKMIADHSNYFVMGVSLGVFIMLLALFIFKFTKEDGETVEKQSNLKLKTEMLSIFKNRGLAYLLWIYVGCYAAANIIEGFVIYYMKYWLNRELDMPILFVIVIGMGIITLPIWTKVALKIGKKQTLLIGLWIWGLAQIAWIIIAPNSPSYIVYVVGAIVGIGYGVAHVLPWSMLPDIMDLDELENGKKREGIYSGVMTFFMKITNSIAIFIIGIVLQFSGYVPNVKQTVSTLNTIKWTMGIAPLLFIIAAIIAILRYPYTKEEHIKIRNQLDQINKEV